MPTYQKALKENIAKYDREENGHHGCLCRIKE